LEDVNRVTVTVVRNHDETTSLFHLRFQRTSRRTHLLVDALNSSLPATTLP